MIQDDLLLPDATASISFTGLGILNTDENRCEYHVVKCHEHRLFLDIQEVVLDANTRKPLSAKVVAHSLNTDSNLDIRVSRPAANSQGIASYHPHSLADPKSFAYVANLRDPDFHGRSLQRKPDFLSKVTPVIRIEAGRLYAQRLSDAPLLIVTTQTNARKNNKKAPEKIATQIGCDIQCVEGGVIMLSDAQNNFVSLAQRPNVIYLIVVENLCEQALPSEGQASGGILSPTAATDFRAYYDLYEVPPQEQLDLRRAIDSTAPGLVGVPDFQLDGDPRICAPVGE